jgi:hypothetical protein
MILVRVERGPCDTTMHLNLNQEVIPELHKKTIFVRQFAYVTMSISAARGPEGASANLAQSTPSMWHCVDAQSYHTP